MVLGILLGISAFIALGVWIKLNVVFRAARIALDTPVIESEDDTPTVSLCIPARNEVHAMTDCLESALRSSYPKLEIIVLDDGSRDDTQHLIKSFAHAGVRFVEGSPLPDGWLGKNHALEGLANEASGSLLLFADVDTRFAPRSIEQLVDCMVHESADMVSVLPVRHNAMRASAILATMRHFWNLLSHSDRHPAVASSAWMIKRSLLLDTLHGFKDVAAAVRPEKSIAITVAGAGQYRFIISNEKLGVSYEKKLSSQRETAVRIYYPEFGLMGVIVRCLGLALCLVPYLALIVGLVTAQYSIVFITLVPIVLLSAVNAWYLGVLRSNNYGLATVSLPFILAREILLLVASVTLYAFGRVTWKGRPVRSVSS